MFLLIYLLLRVNYKEPQATSKQVCQILCKNASKLKINSPDFIIYIMTQVQSLQQLLEKAPFDKYKLFTLLQIGRHKGFGSAINRKQIWPYLMGLDFKKMKQTPIFQWKGGMDRTSADFDQLMKDAQRSLSSLKTFEDIDKFHLKKRQEAVFTTLDTLFAKNSKLRYIQGFHDVASIYLILFGNSNGYYLIEKAAQTYFFDFLSFEFGDVGRAVSRVVYNIITEIDPEFKQIFSNFEVSKFFIFLIPWILTWFAHNITNTKTICRIWDYLLCTGPYAIFYLTSAIILMTKNQLLNQCEELDDPNIHTFYQSLVKNQGINIEKAIAISIQLQTRVNIEETEGFSQLDERSMFRYQNFIKKNTIHVQYYKERKRKQDMKKRMIKIVKVGTILAVTAATILAFKHSDKIKSLAFGEL